MSKIEIWLAWYRYRRDQAHCLWLRATGRCPSCGQRRGQHKFGCVRRSGRGAQLFVNGI